MTKLTLMLVIAGYVMALTACGNDYRQPMAAAPIPAPAQQAAAPMEAATPMVAAPAPHMSAVEGAALGAAGGLIAGKMLNGGQRRPQQMVVHHYYRPAPRYYRTPRRRW